MLQIRQWKLGPMETNCYLVGCEQTLAAAIIDPAWNGRGIVYAAESDGWTIEKILLTHAHFDHLGGLADVKTETSAPLYVHSEAIGDLKSAPMLAAFFGLTIEQPPPADEMLVDGQSLAVGTIRVEVIYTPGHAPGHVSFFLPGYGVLFCGDVLALEGVGRTDLPGGDHGVLMATIRDRLMTLDDAVRVFPGHGPQTTIGHERRSNPLLID